MNNISKSKVLLLLLLLLSVSGFTHANKAKNVLDKQITIHCAAERLESVLSRIEQNADIKFVFSPKIIQSNRAVTLNVHQEKLSTVLNNLLNPMKLNYEFAGNKIVLSQVKTVETTTSPNVRVADEITGKVKTANGEAMPGVSILIKGTTRGTVSDPNGNFRLDTKVGNILVASFIGYNTENSTDYIMR